MRQDFTKEISSGDKLQVDSSNYFSEWTVLETSEHFTTVARGT